MSPQAKGIKLRALAVINPGNPTGNCLPVDNMQQIVQFCADRKLILMADEVYQTNIYGSVPFTSFKKVATEMSSDVALVSFHSTSKGFVEIRDSRCSDPRASRGLRAHRVGRTRTASRRA